MNSITVINIFRFVAPLAGLMLLLVTLPRLLGQAALPRGFHLLVTGEAVRHVPSRM